MHTYRKSRRADTCVRICPCVYEYHVSIKNMRGMDRREGTEGKEAECVYAEMGMALWIQTAKINGNIL